MNHTTQQVAQPQIHTRRQLLQYSFLALPLAFAGLPIYIHAPELYASEIGVSLTTLGLVLLVLRIIDAVQDPLIGAVSDRLHPYRRHILAAGMVLLAVGFWMVFHPAIQQPVVWFSIAVVICTTGFSIVSINFQALGGLWQAGVAERTRITSWREAVGLIGLLLASIAPTLLGKETSAAGAFHLLSLLYIPLLLLAAVVFFIWMRGAVIRHPLLSESSPSFRRLVNAWNLQFFCIYLCNAFASAIPAVLVIFFINDRIQSPAMTGIFLLMYFVSGAAAMPLWQWVAGKTGKKRAWMYSMLLATVTFIWAFTLASGDTTPYVLICVLSGLALGADLALPPSIIADRIDSQRDYHLASRYFSITTFLSKAALALATGITLPLLGIAGYQPGDVTDYRVTDYLSYIYALIPSLIKGSVAIWLWYFDHTCPDHA